MTSDESGKNYVINGRKWWASGAGESHCKIMIVMTYSPNPNKLRH